MSPNVYLPDQVRALQTAFDRGWYLIGPTYSLSKDAVAQLIVALAADGGAEDRDEIDIDSLVHEALDSVMAYVQRVKQRDAWSDYSRQRASHVWSLNDNLKPLLLH